MRTSEMRHDNAQWGATFCSVWLGMGRGAQVAVESRDQSDEVEA